MKNQDVAHQFFYDRNGSFDRRSMTVSYGYNKFWSYGTVIGKITENRQGKTIFLISDNTFSNTTAKHIGELKYACPYYNIYSLPQRIGNSDFYIRETFEHITKNLEYYSTEKMTRQNNREQFTKYYNMLASLLEIKGFEEYDKDIKKQLKKHKKLHEDINSPEKLAEIREKQKARDKAKREKLKKQLAKFDKLSLMDKAELAYTSRDLEQETRQKLRDFINPHHDLSFCWFNGDVIETSQGIRVDKKEALVLLKLWQAGKLKHGMTISIYTVRAVMPDYVQIGCHKIPAENLQNMYDSITKQQKKAA